MDRYLITYKNKPWPVMEVTIFQDTDKPEDVLVATTDLEDELLEDMQSNTSSVERVASKLDDEICYYVRPEEIGLPYSDIIRIVEQSYE